MDKHFSSAVYDRPTIQFFPSPQCNLHCPYCSQGDVLCHEKTSSVIESPDSEFIEQIEPTHFYISGGEPFIHKNLPDFLRRLYINGHTASFDTNGCVSLDRLENIIKEFPPSFFGFFNISHHILSGVSLDFISKRATLLREASVPHFVKYIGTPAEIPTIRNYMQHLSSAGTGTAVSPILTFSENWKGKSYPMDYTESELLNLLNMVTLKTHAMQFFGGVELQSQSCLAPGRYMTFNMKNHNEACACCHRSDELSKNVLNNISKKNGPLSCNQDNCIGDLMFIFGLQGIFDEKNRFQEVCNGPVEPIGIKGILDFFADIKYKCRLQLQDKLSFLKN